MEIIDKYLSILKTKIKEVKSSSEQINLMLTDLDTPDIKLYIKNPDKYIIDRKDSIPENELTNLINDLKLEVRKYQELMRKQSKLEYELKILNAKFSDITRHLEEGSNEYYIDKYQIGGYVESLDNISADESEPAWIDNMSRIWGNSIISNNTYVAGKCTISNYGLEPTVIKNSVITGHCTINTEGSTISNSILTDMVEIHNSVSITNCIIKNYSMVYDSADINNTFMEVGACVRSNAVVSNSILLDTAHVHNNAIVNSCICTDETSIYSKTVSGEIINQQIELKETRGNEFSTI